MSVTCVLVVDAVVLVIVADAVVGMPFVLVADAVVLVIVVDAVRSC